MALSLSDEDNLNALVFMAAYWKFLDARNKGLVAKRSELFGQIDKLQDEIDRIRSLTVFFLSMTCISLCPPCEAEAWPQNISVFLHSLAEDQSKCAIAVILSGLDSDGAAALKPIKDAGGIVIAQDINTAKSPDMPLSALNTGCVDFLLSPVEIAKKLQAIAEERIRKTTS
jgi:CheB methylesterase